MQYNVLKVCRCPVHGILLELEKEPLNSVDSYASAVAVMKGGTVVGHVP